MDDESSAQLGDEMVAQLLAQFNGTASATAPELPLQEEYPLPEYELAQQALASRALLENASVANGQLEYPVEYDVPQDTAPEHTVTDNPQAMDTSDSDIVPRTRRTARAARAPTTETVDHIPRASQLPQIEIPFFAESDEYEYLPGHFEVRCVISETDPVNEVYKVKLRSGEIEPVRFLTLPSSHFNLHFS